MNKPIADPPISSLATSAGTADNPVATWLRSMLASVVNTLRINPIAAFRSNPVLQRELLVNLRTNRSSLLLLIYQLVLAA
ncbi:MAG: ABC transporter permease, partial [Rhodopirellula bahusiensis]